MSATRRAAKPISAARQVETNPNSEQLNALAESEIWDESNDDRFSQFAELANLIFGSAIASISLLKPARQWIRSAKQQLSITDFEAFIASCAVITPLEEPVILPDILQDARFKACLQQHNLDGLRFFVRIALRNRANQLIGSLCIADFEPRSKFSPRDHEILNRLGVTISETVEAQRQSFEPQSSEIEANHRYALIARATLDGVWDWDIAKGTVYYSPRWQYILGLTECDVTAGLDHWLARVHPDDQSAVKEGLEQNLSGKTSRFRSEHRVRHGDGSWRWIAVRGLAQRSSENLPIRMAGSVADVTEERTSDILTGLPNRLSFLDRTSQLIERGKKYGNWHFAVLAIDIDRLAQFNEKFGHAYGDMVLRTIADRVEETVTRTRIGDGSLVSRFESDKFFILLEV